MYKLYFSLGLILYSFSFFAQNSSDEKVETYFLTFNVEYGFQKGGHVQNLFMDIGTKEEHPFYGKMKNIDDDKVALGSLSNIQVFSNEIDLLIYLSNEGWEIINVIDMKELATTYKQFLMRLEK